jgi:hypothetical protein
MELHLTRDEILRQVRSMLGIQMDSGLSSQVDDQHTSMVNAAALKVQQDCGWVNAQKRVTIMLGQAQSTISYPDACGPGAVRGIAVWDPDAKRYYPLEARVIPVQADQDQLRALGGEDFTGAQGRPRYYQQRAQIELFPTSDKAYPLRIDYLARATMSNAGDVSIVDGQLIIFAAASMISQQSGDPIQAKYYEVLYGDRRNALMGWQSEGTRFAMATEADLGEDEFAREDLFPSWDRRPTLTPP